MLFFNFSIKNLTDTYYYMTSLNYEGVQALGFSISNLFRWLGGFLVKLSVLDLWVFLFSVFILVKIIFKKPKTKQEKFTLYLVLLCFLIITFFKSGIMVGLVHAMPFMFGFFILMSLTFSDEPYSILRTFKIKKKYFLIFLIAYTVISFSTLYFAPFHRFYNNPLICPILKYGACEQHLQEIKPTTQYLENILKDDETFLPTGIYNFYYRYNDDILWWIFYSNFKKQTGKEPRLVDYLKYYKPEGRRVRYLYTDPYPTEPNPGGLELTKIF